LTVSKRFWDEPVLGTGPLLFNRIFERVKVLLKKGAECTHLAPCTRCYAILVLEGNCEEYDRCHELLKKKQMFSNQMFSKTGQLRRLLLLYSIGPLRKLPCPKFASWPQRQGKFLPITIEGIRMMSMTPNTLIYVTHNLQFQTTLPKSCITLEALQQPL
jgi:hypothetical protein